METTKSLLEQGLALQLEGQFAQAGTLYRQVLAQEPRNLSALQLLALTCSRTGLLEEGVELLRTAIAVNPAFASFHSNLGLLLTDLGDHGGAIAAHRRAVSLVPHPGEAGFFDPAVAWMNLGLALARAGRPEEALQPYAEALARSPDLHEARSALAASLVNLGRDADARAVLARMQAGQPSDATRLRLALCLSGIPESKEESQREREALEAEIDRMLAAPCLISEPLREVNLTAFYLAYHGMDDRRLHEKLARLYLHACPSLAWVAPHCERARGPHRTRIRVGVISRFLHAHSIGKTTQGFFTAIDRSRFELVAIFVPPLVKDACSEGITREADQAVFLPDDLDAARRVIASLELDVLFYQDINMEPFTYFLAFSRLAHVQCTSFGHPDTTGIPAMDCFVSSSLYETEGSAAHYSERLACIPEVPTLAYYLLPPQPPARTRRDLGLPEGRLLYLCPQTLFKFHPDFDRVLVELLGRDPRGLLLLMGRLEEVRMQRLLARLERVRPGISSQVAVLPLRSRQDFLALLRTADVVLDTFHFGGMNSSLETFAVGTPVITLPGAFQRGRHTLGMYRAMDLDDCIARDGSHYVDLAYGIASQPDRREELSARILPRCGCLFERKEVVRGFERFFESALETALRS